MALFRPGTSGNPRGRPVGKSAAARFRKALEKACPEVLQAVMDAAKKGDTSAARLVLDRVCPSLRPTDLPVRVPTAATDIAARVAAITDAALAGQITPDTALSLLSAMSHGAKVIEFEGFDARIRALEAKAGLLAQAPTVPASTSGERANAAKINGIGHADL